MRLARLTSVACISGALAVALACGSSATSPSNQPSVTTPPVPGGLSVTLTAMLYKLAGQIVSASAELRDSLPRNSQLATLINAKLTMLSNPALINEIFNDRRWVEGYAPASVGGAIPIAAVFPLEGMRAECGDAVETLKTYLPILVDYFDRAFPTGKLELWYGFNVGGSGGGGAIYIVDRTTKAAFPPSGSEVLPYEATFAHEAAHSYIGNEALTQFLEVYVHNVSRGRGVDPAGWDYTRGWAPGTPSTFGVTYVLDVYLLVGPDVMQRAYRAIRPLSPAYGQPLSQAVIDAFVAQVPEALRATVRAKLGQIIA